MNGNGNGTQALAIAAMKQIQSKVFPMIGEVVEVDDDGSKHPQGLYPSIKVRFREVKPFVSPWIRWGAPKTGPGTGQYWVPDIGDDVIVIYTMGSVHKPIIALSLWNGVDRPPEGYKKGVHGWKDTVGNALRVCELDSEGIKIHLESGGGHSVTLDHTKGQDRVRIESSEGHKVTLDDTENEIEIESAGGHKMTMDDKPATRSIKIIDPTGNYFLIDTKKKIISMKQILNSHVTIDSTGGITARCGPSGATMSLSALGVATLMSMGGMFSVNQFGAFSGMSAGGISFEGSSLLGSDPELKDKLHSPYKHEDDVEHLLQFKMPDGSYYEFEAYAYHNRDGRLIQLASGFHIGIGRDGLWSAGPYGMEKQFGYSLEWDDDGHDIEQWYQDKAEIEDVCEQRIYRHVTYDPGSAEPGNPKGLIEDERGCLMKAPSAYGGDLECSVSESTVFDPVEGMWTTPSGVLQTGKEGPWVRLHPANGCSTIELYSQHALQVASAFRTGGAPVNPRSAPGKYNMNLWHSGRKNGKIHLYCEAGKIDIESPIEINLKTPILKWNGLRTSPAKW